MAGAVTNSIVKSLTDLGVGNNFSGTSAVGQESKDVAKSVDRLFLEEDKLVREIVQNKGELAKPENRKAVNKGINKAKDNTKTALSGLQDKDIPKTIRDFQSKFLAGIAMGMLIGNVKMALALIPVLPQAEPQVKSKPADETLPEGIKPGDVDKAVEEIFASEDEFVKMIADRREELAKPGNRKEAEEFIEEIKTGITEHLGSLTEKDLPKNADKAREAYLEALLGGLIAGSMKTALALIPVKTIEPKPELPEPVICPK